MTISTTTNRVPYTGNGVAVAFSFPYAFFAQADLVVVETIIATGVQTVKTLTTHYTISGSVDALGHYSSGGTVTAVTAPASTVTWTIYRDPTATQTTDLVENDPMPAESIEAALDYQTMLNQRTRDIAARSLQQPEGDSATIGRLPAKVDRADTVLAFDSDGDPIPAVLTAAVGTALPITGGTLTGNLTVSSSADPKITLNTTHASNRRMLLHFNKSGTTKYVIGTDFDAADDTNSLTFYDADLAANILQLTAAGVVSIPKGQLKFPATQNASADANTLDDYEEGIWTPSIGGSATYTTAAGKYTKIGRVVYVHCQLVINVIGSGSVDTISGLPFTAVAGADSTVTVGDFASLATNVAFLAGRINAGAATITLRNTTAAAASATSSTLFGNGAGVTLSGFYFV